MGFVTHHGHVDLEKEIVTPDKRDRETDTHNVVEIDRHRDSEVSCREFDNNHHMFFTFLFWEDASMGGSRVEEW